MTFAQLSARLKNFLRGWLLVLGLKEGLVECATVCVKSVVILINVSELALEGTFSTIAMQMLRFSSNTVHNTVPHLPTQFL